MRYFACGRAWRRREAAREEPQPPGGLPPGREALSLCTLASQMQIASELGTTEKTIKVHRGRVMSKLGADSVVDLVRLAQQTDQLAG